MATRRRPLRPTGPSSSNFRPGGPDITRAEAKGTRPTAPPTSVREIFVMMVMHACKKTIFFDINLKVALYLGSLFVVSLIGDFVPFPKTYFARSDNLFNVYFVKIGWGWTLLLSIPFIFMTSYTLCCGDGKQFLKHHLPRILIATFFWFFWTKMFNIIETAYGKCTVKGFHTKSSCLKDGHLWHGFDISGHAFILIHSSLVLIEEARPILRWESIKEHIRNELHDRSISEHSSTNPLRNLSSEQIRNLKFLYERLTPAIRTLFIGISALQLLWDVMLVVTMLYYHRMIEKVLSGILAILTWYFTYRFWYRTNVLPDPPGSGSFFYQRENKDIFVYKRTPSMTSYTGPSTSTGIRSGNSGTGAGTTQTQVPTFMGMPIYVKSKPNASGNQSTDLST
ncbi:fat storage-inducing transmembrane protein [Teleopsis dalmanni]|uniref:fat storage-inducing transmembrane protein n=1 Tax=Teleopsis dalmanni TaxID=139649 RepID=UPI000D32BB04|nr:fat storage-inducing transmembrane protein [Teleopsis dalmanni]